MTKHCQRLARISFLASVGMGYAARFFLEGPLITLFAGFSSNHSSRMAYESVFSG